MLWACANSKYLQIDNKDGKLKLERLKKRTRKPKTYLEDRSGKGYEGFKLTDEMVENQSE